MIVVSNNKWLHIIHQNKGFTTDVIPFNVNRWQGKVIIIMQEQRKYYSIHVFPIFNNKIKSWSIKIAI